MWRFNTIGVTGIVEGGLFEGTLRERGLSCIGLGRVVSRRLARAVEGTIGGLFSLLCVVVVF